MFILINIIWVYFCMYVLFNSFNKHFVTFFQTLGIVSFIGALFWICLTKSYSPKVDILSGLNTHSLRQAIRKKRYRQLFYWITEKWITYNNVTCLMFEIRQGFFLMCAKTISENRCHMFEGKIWTLYRKVWRDKCSNCNMFSKTEEEKKKRNSLSILFSFNIYKTIYYYKMPICRVRHSWSVNSQCDCISIFQPEGFYSTSSQDIKGFQCAYKSVHKFPLSSPDKAQSLLVSSSDVVADWS